VKPHETAGRHEGQGEEQDAGIPAPVGRLTRREAESERDGTHEPEEHEMKPGVHEVGVELRAEQERDEPDQRQRGGQELGDSYRSNQLSGRGRYASVRVTLFG
jgi:hypothetical protein